MFRSIPLLTNTALEVSVEEPWNIYLRRGHYDLNIRRRDITLVIGGECGRRVPDIEGSGFEGGARQGYLERPYPFVAMNDISPSMTSRGVEESDEAPEPSMNRDLKPQWHQQLMQSVN